ncbi:Fungal transcriptional regulatory N-terminal [Pyrenophora seminiperda CCB06]|uniref:Fungal transcriptional regulatory N-terminal n=1 Tax=Pyrenophora seminiperda CCB06 TaxID=1302712 RepID=A0A3M7MC35_9PLEO|nr:Fungal transcriptional regulatory N-terminal [Pyrenophora seminiperda CCB06]
MSEAGIKTSQRVSRSCIECGRRKIRCDKKSPCQPCIRRNAAHECKRPIARVRGQLTVYAAADGGNPADVQLQDLLRERGAMRAQIAELETALALSKPCAHSRTSESTDYSQPAASLEDLVPAFEQFDIGIRTSAVARYGAEKDIADRLYEPAADPLFLLLPSKDASLQLVNYSLQTLGWLHCAVNADVFLEEHQDFWQRTQLGTGIAREQRPWLIVYFAVLAVGILYLEPERIPGGAHLPQLGLPLVDPVAIAVHTSRIWYEAALKELERYGFTGAPSLPVVQALSVLTLCHSNFGEHQREWLITGFATNMARCLDMHKLGTETNCSKDLCRRPEWSSPSQRELGRRLWWSCVIRDWYVMSCATSESN